jgi:hypothetical protein
MLVLGIPDYRGARPIRQAHKYSFLQKNEGQKNGGQEGEKGKCGKGIWRGQMLESIFFSAILLSYLSAHHLSAKSLRLIESTMCCRLLFALRQLHSQVDQVFHPDMAHSHQEYGAL